MEIHLNVVKVPETNDIEGFLTCIDVTDAYIQKQLLDTVIRFEYDYVANINLLDDRVILFRGKNNEGVFEEYAETRYYSYEEFVNKVAEYVINEEKNEFIHSMEGDVIKASVRQEGMHEFTVNVKTVKGAVRVKRIRFVSHGDDENTLIFNITDVTELFIKQEKQRMELQRSLESANRANRAKTEFFSRMSHDIRNPMNAIIGMTGLAKEEDVSEQAMEYLDNIDTSSHFLLGLINDILDITKIESGEIELYPDVYTIEEFARNINTVIRPLMEARKIDFIFQMACGATCLYVDKLRYNQIFFNLLSNAAKFTPVGGCVEFVSERIPDRDGKHGSRIYVRDNGIGMSKDFLPHIFESFTQEKSKYSDEGNSGTGLGLPIVKSLVDAMGGNIYVNSVLGKGTEFIVELYIPIATREDKDESEDIVVDYDFTGKRVLLVEDNELNIIVAKRLLEKKGFEVDVAVNGELALKYYGESEKDYYDAILMDVRMPVMNGLEATRTIRKLTRVDAMRIPIIAMTADAFEKEQKQMLEAGMNDHLEKPIDPAKVYETLHKWIDSGLVN